MSRRRRACRASPNVARIIPPEATQTFPLDHALPRAVPPRLPRPCSFLAESTLDLVADRADKVGEDGARCSLHEDVDRHAGDEA